MMWSRSQCSSQRPSIGWSVGRSCTTVPSLATSRQGKGLHLRPGRLTAEDAGSQDLPGQDAAHPGSRCAARDVGADGDAVEVEVVDDADGFARVVDELAVQQVQPGVQ